jgi:hypothetical protein
MLQKNIIAVCPEMNIIHTIALCGEEVYFQGYLLGGKRSWCVRLTTLTPSSADCLEILKT